MRRGEPPSYRPDLAEPGEVSAGSDEEACVRASEGFGLSRPAGQDSPGTGGEQAGARSVWDGRGAVWARG